MIQMNILEVVQRMKEIENEQENSVVLSLKDRRSKLFNLRSEAQSYAHYLQNIADLANKIVVRLAETHSVIFEAWQAEERAADRELNKLKYQAEEKREAEIAKKFPNDNPRRRYMRQRYHSLPKNHPEKVASRARGRLNKWMQTILGKRHGGKRVVSAVRDCGCSIQALKTYLESKFQPGMTWDNYGPGKGQWQVDHITPFCKCENSSDKSAIMPFIHYTNLQPLWFEDHVKKSIEERKTVTS